MVEVLFNYYATVYNISTIFLSKFLYRWASLGTGIVTRRPLVLQLHKSDLSAEYAEFLHKPKHGKASQTHLLINFKHLI